MSENRTELSQTTDKAYIYTLSDPRDNQIRYVGVTKNLKQRRQSHISASTSGCNKKDAWIDELRAGGIDPILTVIEETEFYVVRETYWIYTYLDQGAPLLNHLNAIKRCVRRDEQVKAHPRFQEYLETRRKR